MIVVLDTTELFNDYWLRSARIRMLHEILQKAGARLIVPDVVVREFQRQYEKDVASAIEDVRRSQKKVNRLLPDGQSFSISKLPNQSALFEAHNQGFVKRLNEIGGEVSTSDDLRVPDLLDRALRERRPFNGDGKKGFRDTLIWEHVLRLASAEDERVVLITKNAKDFAGDGDSLHPDLADDLDKRAIPRDRVSVVIGLNEFNGREAEKHLQRLLPMEDELDADKHAKLSLRSLLRTFKDTISSELNGNLEPLASRLEYRFDSTRENYRLEKIEWLGLDNAIIENIKVVKLEDGDVTISFKATFEVEVWYSSDARLRTKHDFFDRDRDDYLYAEIEMWFEVVANPKSGEVFDFSITDW